MEKSSTLPPEYDNEFDKRFRGLLDGENHGEDALMYHSTYNEIKEFIAWVVTCERLKNDTQIN